MDPDPGPAGALPSPPRAQRRSALEVGRYDVDADVTLPDLTGLDGVARATSAEHRLETVYYDTADARLRGAGTTLRHRAGGTDAGWHLELPTKRGREEVAVTAGPEEVPEPLRALVRARVRRQDLAPVAALSTHRTTQRLLDASGTPLLEVADERVTGRPLPTGAELAWRAWGVERVLGGDDLLDAVEQVLLRAGARPAEGTSEVRRVLARRTATVAETPWWAGTPGAARGATAGSAVQAHLAQHVEALLARDPHTRRDAPGALHKMRVATRRLRSALQTFRPLLDRDRTEPVRTELDRLAGVLGAARDAEVMRARLRTLLAAEADDLVLGDVRERADAHLARRHRAAHDAVLHELDGERYLRLLDALDELVAAPPFRPEAGGDAARVLRPLVRRTWRRLDRAMEAAEHAAPGPGQDVLLHAARKDAKRSRYAAEAVVPVFGRPARRYAAAVAELQQTLGDFQDGVVTTAVLRELGALGHAAGANGFTFGRLHALEQVRAEAAVARFPRARAAVSRRDLRRWLRDPGD